MESKQSPTEIRARINEDLANGKTVVLSSRELDDPSLREQLPKLLEELASSHSTTASFGPRVPGYTILGEIGQGGMSTVYLARQDNLGRHVAIKIAPKWLGGGERARRMLVQEAHAMARLTHPNIVVIHDIIDVDDTFAIAMEWVDGRTLTSLLRTLPQEPSDDDMVILQTALGAPEDARDNFADTPLRHFVRLIHDIALAVQTVHENDLLHLDIKPSNVLVRRDGTPLLADFGVTRDITPELTQTRTFAGTPIYAAPEQLRRDDKLIGPSTDVYSLGVTLYEALARSQPLRSLDLPGIVKCVEAGGMPQLSQKVAVPPDLNNIVHKAIAPEPEHRYQTAAAFADDLLAFLEHRPVLARPLTRTQRLRRWMHNEPWKAGLAATLAIVLPMLAVLGTYLAVQWPTIARANVAERLERANHIKQETLQRLLVSEISSDIARQRLEQALELDPGDTTLACLFALASEAGWDIADQTVESHSARAPSSEGLRLFSQKVAERRSFFNDDEADVLRASQSPIDHYVLALDRVFKAADRGTEESSREAQACLEEAALNAAPDPLLLGLLGWSAMRSGDRDRFDATTRNMQQRWPTDPIVRAWAPLAIEPYGPDKAKQLARSIIEMAPSHPRGYELLVGAHLRTKQYELVDAVVEEARRANALSAETQTLQLYSRSRQGDRSASEQLLRAERRTRITATSWFTVTSQLDEEKALARAQAIADSETPSPFELQAAALQYSEVRELFDQLWEKFCRLYPDRRKLHSSRFRQMYIDQDMQGAAKIAAEFTLRSIEIDMYAMRTVRALSLTRDWHNMLRHAETWLEFGSMKQQATYFIGLAHARTNHPELAAEFLAKALTRNMGKKSWFAQALLEDAWLRSSPEAPRALRNPALAKLRIDEFHRRNPTLMRPHAGPWTQLVLAEVLYANGDREAAIETIKQGLLVTKREVIAPRHYEAKMQAALERMK